MSTPALQVVQNLYEAFARRDMASIFAGLSPEVEIEQSEELPWGGRYRGHAGAREFLGRLTTHVESTVTVERMIDAGEHVAVTGWTRGTVRASGARFDVPLAHVWQISAGQVVRVQFMIDHATMRPALAKAPADGVEK
jgi:hypothetical protein